MELQPKAALDPTDLSGLIKKSACKRDFVVNFRITGNPEIIQGKASDNPGLSESPYPRDVPRACFKNTSAA